jgi:hypothetical protein
MARRTFEGGGEARRNGPFVNTQYWSNDANMSAARASHRHHLRISSRCSSRCLRSHCSTSIFNMQYFRHCHNTCSCCTIGTWKSCGCRIHKSIVCEKVRMSWISLTTCSSLLMERAGCEACSRRTTRPWLPLWKAFSSTWAAASSWRLQKVSQIHEMLLQHTCTYLRWRLLLR